MTTSIVGDAPVLGEVQAGDRREHVARVSVSLNPEATRVDEDQVIARIIGEFNKVPDCPYTLGRPSLFTFRDPIEIEVFDEDLDLLRSSALAIEDRLELGSRTPRCTGTGCRSGARGSRSTRSREDLCIWPLPGADCQRSQGQGHRRSRHAVSICREADRYPGANERRTGQDSIRCRDGLRDPCWRWNCRTPQGRFPRSTGASAGTGGDSPSRWRAICAGHRENRWASIWEPRPRERSQ